MEHNNEKARKAAPIEKLQEDVDKLREDIRSLEIQVAGLSNLNAGKTASAVDACELPHLATEKQQRCKSCKYMRMPHRSNAHYTCNVRHSTIEPTWTCELYNNKNNQMISEPGTYCGH